MIPLLMKHYDDFDSTLSLSFKNGLQKKKKTKKREMKKAFFPLTVKAQPHLMYLESPRMGRGTALGEVSGARNLCLLPLPGVMATEGLRLLLSLHLRGHRAFCSAFGFL